MKAKSWRKSKKTFKEIENREKSVEKKRIIKYFSYEPITLVNKLLSQNTQDLRKSLNDIKQQKIKLNKDERNSTNIKSENDRLNNILSVIDRIYRFSEYEFLSDKEPDKQPDKQQDKQPDESNLPKWIKVSN